MLHPTPNSIHLGHVILGVYLVLNLIIGWVTLKPPATM